MPKKLTKTEEKGKVIKTASVKKKTGKIIKPKKSSPSKASVREGEKTKVAANEKQIKKENVEELAVNSVNEEGEQKEDREDKDDKKNTYYYAVGRRKSAVAQVRLYKKGEGEIKINDKELKNYFPREEWQTIITAPLKVMGQTNKLNVLVTVYGGGVKAQAEAVRLGISRALLKLNPIFKRGLKKYGYLTRDSRIKERKKFGLKGARRAPQWAKR